MRILLVAVSGMMLFASVALAQDNNVESSASALQGVLENLKESVQRLSVHNDQLAAQDNDVKNQILQLQAQFGNLQAEGDSLSQESEKMKEQNLNLAQNIAGLQEESLDLDHRLQKSREVIKVNQHLLDESYQEEQESLLKLKAVQNILPPPDLLSAQSVAMIHRQKEKLKLMKMIYDSQQRQEALHESIIDIQKSMPLLTTAAPLAHQQLLKEQIKDLESQVASFTPERFTASSDFYIQWDDTQLHQLESELKSLEQNYLQLKGLMGEMTKKALASRLTLAQKIEEHKLQGSIEDLNHQAAQLRIDLDDLRSQLVDLDKRKFRLETILKQQ